MKVLLFDNYDSFTYNLLHILKELGAEVEVHRNDKISLDEVERFDKILLSPGPGIPEEAGILLPLIRRYAPTKSILGVCLGEQAIGQAFCQQCQCAPLHRLCCSPWLRCSPGRRMEHRLGRLEWLYEGKGIRFPDSIS